MLAVMPGSAHLMADSGNTTVFYSILFKSDCSMKGRREVRESVSFTLAKLDGHIWTNLFNLFVFSVTTVIFVPVLGNIQRFSFRLMIYTEYFQIIVIMGERLLCFILWFTADVVSTGCPPGHYGVTFSSSSLSLWCSMSCMSQWTSYWPNEKLQWTSSFFIKFYLHSAAHSP